MSAGDRNRGPQVAAHEDLFRAVAYSAWWKPEANRPSSAVFTDRPPISVDVASLTSEQEVLSRFKPGTGLITFNAGIARGIGFDARKEDDADHPENRAHAHLYCDLGNNQRKRAARKLVEAARVVRSPDLSLLD